jgi:hypothetical protein
MLRIFPGDYAWSDAHIRLKMRDLRSALFRESDEGRARFHLTSEAYEIARKDARFQAFKELIPALCEIKRRRGGRSRAASSEADRA